MLEFDKSKLRRLTAKRDSLRAVMADLSQRLRDARLELQKAQQHAQRVVGRGAHLKGNRELSFFERERIGEASAQITLLDGELHAAREQFDLVGPVVSRCEQWLREQGPHRGGDRPTPVPAKDPAKATAKLDKLRDDIGALIEQRQTIQDAPLPRAEALQRIDQWIELQASEVRAGGFLSAFATPGAMVDGGPFSVSMLTVPIDTGLPVHTAGSRPRGDLDTAAAQLAHDAFGLATGDYTPAPSPVRPASSGPAVYSGRLSMAPVLCWLFPEQLRERLAAELTIDESAAIPAGERASKLADTAEQLHALELDEEALVASLEAAGEQVHRRHDFDPSIVLDVRRVDAPEPAYVPEAEFVTIDEAGRTTRAPLARSSMVSTDRQSMRDAQ